jgi:hypothetical protein
MKLSSTTSIRPSLLLDGVDGDVAEEDRIRPHAQIVLDLAEDDLLAGPLVLDDAAEPWVLEHRHLSGDCPELVDQCIR